MQVMELNRERTAVQRSGRAGDPEGGPYISLTIEFAQDRIGEVVWESNGCPAAQMAACALAAFLKGRSVGQARLLDAAGLLALIGGLPEGKAYYAALAIEAMNAALPDGGPC